MTMQAWMAVAASVLAATGVTQAMMEDGAGQQAQLLQERARARWERVPRQALAFYYGWYGNPKVSGRWVHWSDVDEKGQRIGGATHYPALGPYDSHDPKVIEDHCRWAKEAGLSGFIVSWWARGDFHDQGMPMLLDAAQKHGLSITAYFETVHSTGAPGPEDALKDVLYLLEQYGKHPAWLKVDGKPVLFVYGRAVGQIGVDGWLRVITEADRRYPGGAVFIGDQISRRAARVFDGIHTYNPTGSTAHKSPEAMRSWARATFPQWVQTAGDDRIACLTVIPGYDDSKLGRPAPRPITDRHDGQTYRVLWEEAIAADPDWVLVTSWNEWHEGSEIEPSVEKGERALKTTATYAPKFRARPQSKSRLRRGAVDERHRAALRSRLQKRSIAVLPRADSEAAWFLMQLGVSPAAVSWGQFVDAREFNPQKYPVLLYGGGEAYPATVHEADDVPRALQRYVEEGGLLAVMPSEPMPFQYDSTRRAPDGKPATVAHAAVIGLPLAIAWEQPPNTPLKFVVTEPKSFPDIPPQFSFPAGGDRRWRPLAVQHVPPGESLRSLVELRDASGKSLGPACALLRQGKGAILYAWFGLLEMPEGEALLHDLWQLIAEQTRGGAGRQ